jgi:hypothetical protein
MELSLLEEDLLGDLAQDDHALYEVFGFVRNHAGSDRADSAHILPLGRTLLDAWIQRGWIAIAPNPKEPSLVDRLSELIPLIDSLGDSATEYFFGAPWLRLEEKVLVDVPWLRGDGRSETTN